MIAQSGSIEDRIRTLPCWAGPIYMQPLEGGLSNKSHIVTDAAGKHVVRIGHDYPFHHVSRKRELMVACAAHAAGFGPKVEYAEPGIMVTAYIKARTYSAHDVRRNAPRIAAMLRSFHAQMPLHVSGPGSIFWVFHVVRDYARLLMAAKARLANECPYYTELANEFEAVQVSLPIIFGHNDLLPANFMDDGNRLWLIDFEYAGFGTALFDVAGTATNAAMSRDEATQFVTHYFGAEPAPALLRAQAAMECASLLREAMWSMVSEIHLDTPGVDFEAYTTDNLGRLDVAITYYRQAFGNRRK